MLCKISLNEDTITRFTRKIVLFILLFPQWAFSQDYFFDTYSVADGLAQSTVFDIHQDHFDHLWLGTREGVSYFDGKQFFNFSLQDGLAENGVKVIFRDSSNTIWFGHAGGGVSFWNGKKFSVFSDSEGVFKSDITGIIQDDEGNIWISSELSGVIKITQAGKTIAESAYKLYIGDDLSDRVFGLYKRSDGSLLFITDAFLKVYSPQTDKFNSFYIEGMPTYFLITCLYEDDEKNLWMGTYNGGVYQFHSDSKEFSVYDLRDGLSSNWITSITKDRSGDLWIATWGGGITVFNEKESRVMNMDNGLPDMKIRKLTEDREGNIIIATNENGIAIFKGYHFMSYSTDDGLRDPQVWSLLQTEKNEIWFGTSRGISVYNTENDEFRTLSGLSKLNDVRIQFLEKDSDSNIYIGTDNQGIFTYDRENKQLVYEPFLNTYLLNVSMVIKAMEADDSGNIWVGLLDGILSYNKESREVNYFTQSKGLSGNEITALHHGSDSKIWIGVRGKGLDYYYEDSIYHLPLDENMTPTSILRDENNSLWVGTEARGLFQLDPDSAKISRHFDEKNGLLANLINSLTTDKSGKIYIGTNRGLTIYDPEPDKVFSYNHKNGFVGIETKPGAAICDRGGRLWFGTIRGVTRLDPQLMQPGTLDPLTHITNFRVNRQNREMKRDTELRHFENDIVFEYISICLKNPESVAYKIMLEGADQNWRPVTVQTSVTYPALAPGYYTFKVMARNSEGLWNREPESFSFSIKPPFYKSSWFISLVSLLGITIIILYIKIRERNLIREKKILEEKVAERTEEVVMQKEELAEKNKNITDSIRYAKRIQVAILPQSVPFEKTFVLFRPKDIVSGDFYWLENAGEREFLAAVDCTGHGVPGAFMSIIGSNLLNKIVKEHEVYQPSIILDILNEELIKNLKTTEEGEVVYDGMDLALVCYHKNSSTLEYAGAFNPLIHIRDNKINEIKADRDSIGRSSIAGKSTKFTNRSLKVEKGDCIYIYSDGYADQFGGSKGKKLKSGRMKELLKEISSKSIPEQYKILDDYFLSWKGEQEQIDDILVIGRKF